MRRARRHRQPGPADRLPPAIRPGLHCGKMNDARDLDTVAHFPRPSGRGSIAAIEINSSQVAGSTLRLPPAIRPGLHCGLTAPDRRDRDAGHFPRPSGRGSIAARRPPRRSVAHYPRFPRPSGRGSIAAGPCPAALMPRWRHFPRPSGRGSIAAPVPSRGSWPARCLPPAIRPGLHCGRGSWQRVRSCSAASPGHQAGAPLRQPGAN